MLWPFNHFRKSHLAPRGTIDAIYGMIVTQAREPLFYRDLGVPDTVNGRFDLIVLHLWMVLRRLGEIAGMAGPAQALFDRFCADMDAICAKWRSATSPCPSDAGFGEAFYGRIAAYDWHCRRPEALAQAICRNVLERRAALRTRGGSRPMRCRSSPALARAGRRTRSRVRRGHFRCREVETVSP